MAENSLRPAAAARHAAGCHTLGLSSTQAIDTSASPAERLTALKSLVNFLLDKPMIQCCIRGFEPRRFLKNGGKFSGVVPRR
jgi:hypothetical protein